tara:strand:+ start:36 stop:563 length:528 start_codon:yes stop_codon:yes gene_type:complete
MRAIAVTTIALSTVALASCQTIEEATPDVIATAAINADGRDVGVGTVIYGPSGASISIALSGLSEGTHAVHLHQTGFCAASDYTSAGGHLNPLGREHGNLNPAGAHLGDLPNVEIGPDRVGTVSATLPGTEEDIRAWLFDEDGTAIIVHAGADDYRTNPSGDAGSRIACGVLMER